jgi:hypothetical protein
VRQALEAVIHFEQKCIAVVRPLLRTLLSREERFLRSFTGIFETRNLALEGSNFGKIEGALISCCRTILNHQTLLALELERRCGKSCLDRVALTPGRADRIL